MVFRLPSSSYGRPILSVLALSSRFDGPNFQIPICGTVATFSTRSVESF